MIRQSCVAICGVIREIDDSGVSNDFGARIRRLRLKPQGVGTTRSLQHLLGARAKRGSSLERGSGSRKFTLANQKSLESLPYSASFPHDKSSRM
jgi:hypothetical protein